MNVVVSPYHLTTREPPAMAALLLAEQVLTLVPASFEDTSAAAAKAVASRSPWYARFMETWSWTVPLWEEGVLASHVERDDASTDMRHVAERLQNDEQYLALRPLMREHLYESDHTYLSSLGADLVKGGPDPGITVPLSAALDRFARRHSCGVARAQAFSVVQKAEAQFAQPLGAIAVPVLVQACADNLLFAREVLEGTLRPLRERLGALAESPDHESNAPDAVARDLRELAGEYAREFDRHSSDLQGSPDDEVRAITGSVVIQLVSMPADVVLRSSLVAVETLATGGRPRREKASAPHANPDSPGATTATMPVLSKDAGSVISLIIKPMGGPRARR